MCSLSPSHSSIDLPSIPFPTASPASPTLANPAKSSRYGKRSEHFREKDIAVPSRNEGAHPVTAFVVSTSAAKVLYSYPLPATDRYQLLGDTNTSCLHAFEGGSFGIPGKRAFKTVMSSTIFIVDGAG